MGTPTATTRLGPPAQRALLEALALPSFPDHVARSGARPLVARAPRVLQVNVGRLCNQTCRHCHVDAGPHQTTANMAQATLDACLVAAGALSVHTVDVTGGAPELHPGFRGFVRALRAAGVARVIDRCNLTVLLLPSQEDLAAFLAEEGVEVVASLPSPDPARTDAQRGQGVFARSLEGLRRLNALGYGLPGSPLRLTLVSNPAGAFLPPPQAAEEARVRRILRERHGVEFHDLIVLANLPISRFLDFLHERGEVEAYVRRLSDAFNPATLDGVMCRDTISVAWDGALHDCDFNQMLEIPVAGPVRSIHDVAGLVTAGRPIRVGRHCLGCTAGQGSSCGGALV